jgi:NAD(P)-dependent dehydrogenase (short-subunit alcohol dehydrogenase family)
MERYVIRRVGDPADIAYAALYLTSDESAYVTGSALAVDGGRTFH